MKHLIKFLLFIGVFCASIHFYYAQNSNLNPCYFDDYTNNKSIESIEAIIQQGVLKSKLYKTNDSLKIIPVVVHVIHYGGVENISDAQIQSQIDIMNEDYGKLPGTNGDGGGVDTKVRFCLAKKDPNGNCTNGIVRVYTNLAYHKTFQRALLKELSFWDNKKYMNIYVVKSINGGSGIAGYSSFPGGPDEEDGMVVLHNTFGNIGSAASSLGRTASHEIGHWFGLYHTFNNGCGTDLCTDGDYVCDTPPQAEPSYDCNVYNSCNNDVPDLNDLKENYMNYTPDNCKNMFTQGQKDRIQSTLINLREEIWSDSNLVATGCDSVYISPLTCPVSANFVTLTPNICVGNTAKFMDISLNDATDWQWSFPGGTPSTSTLENPTIVYDSIGSFDVQLIASNDSTSDTLLIANYISVANPGVGISLPYSENFDSGIFPPNNITINNYDGGVTWQLDSSAYVSPNYSVKIDNYINTNYGSSDEIVLPELDLTSGNTSYLTFDWAYARSDPSYSDELVVLLSTDCGSNYTTVFYKSGNNLVTGPTQTTPFIPDSSQWESAQISLNTYGNEQFVLIKIVNITDGGNNLYIDNINVGELTTGVNDGNISEDIQVYPNPVQDVLTIRFTNPTTKQQVKIYNSLGKEVLSKRIEGSKNISVPIRTFPSGIYYVKIFENSNVFIKKIIKSK